MSQVAAGQAVPNIELLITGNRRVSLADYRGKPLVLFFYPKASTPGCTQEGLDFKDAVTRFRRHSAVILIAYQPASSKAGFIHRSKMQSSCGSVRNLASSGSATSRSPTCGPSSP